MNRLLLTFILFVSVLFSSYGQRNGILMVSGNGKVIDLFDGYNGTISLLSCSTPMPIIKPGTKTLLLKVYENETTLYGELRKSDHYALCTIYYDPLGNVERINSVSFVPHRLEKEYVFHYENNKVVMVEQKEGSTNEEFRYLYDEKGRLTTRTHRNEMIKYTTDGLGNIIKLDEYKGAYLQRTHTCRCDNKGRKIQYYYSFNDYLFGHISHEIKWNYNSNGILLSVIEDGSFENIFEYCDGEINPARCIVFFIGDIKIKTASYQFEYEYTYYPTEEELKKQEEEQRRMDSIRLEEQKQAELLAQEAERLSKQKEKYKPFRCLFDSDETFIACFSTDLDAAEIWIKSLIVNKMQFVSSKVLSGKELQEKDHAGTNELLQICNMCVQIKNNKHLYNSAEKEFADRICDYSEKVLGEFVSGRHVLKKAYKKSSYNEFAPFLQSCINEKTQYNLGSNDRKQDSSLLWTIGYYVSVIGVACFVSWYATRH